MSPELRTCGSASILVRSYLLLAVISTTMAAQVVYPAASLIIADAGYYVAPAVNVMVFDDFYPEGHQGGLTVIQHGTRIAANGDVRLEPTPGQWAPVPAVGPRVVDRVGGAVRVNLWYPDSTKNRRGFNPIVYPDLTLRYVIRTEALGPSLRIVVDLETPLPTAWAGKAGFNLEIFPAAYFGDYFMMDGRSGPFPRQATGPMVKDADGILQPVPLASGKDLTIAPGDPSRRLRIESRTGDLVLYDGRALHNNGWFVVRSVMDSGATQRAVEWIITPTQDPSWRYQPSIQVSQVGYHPRQNKFAVIELDASTSETDTVQLVRIGGDSETIARQMAAPPLWGRFLRYSYVRFDFSDVTAEGLYFIRYGSTRSHTFEIRTDLYARHVWQPTLETFLPVQMCHIRVEDRYKVWHGLCHMDDALMAPVNHNHFDGYIQHGSTLTPFAPGEHVPGLNVGGWHDAGDYDLRVESQAETVYKLSLAQELFGVTYDATTISQGDRRAVLHRPDGKSDLLQQIEHGALSIIRGYRSLGRLYRGIICPTLQQYVHLGDAATMSDQLVYRARDVDPVLGRPLPMDDRWVFTEENSGREFSTAQALAAAYRALRSIAPSVADSCLFVARALFRTAGQGRLEDRLLAAGELYLSTGEEEYRLVLLEHRSELAENVLRYSEILGRVVGKLQDASLTRAVREGVRKAYQGIADQQRSTPYGVPYTPHIWGAGWGIQSFGVRQLFLHLGFPDEFPSEYVFNALNFILGCHPGENTASFVSGVGARSLTVAYGTNRDEWSYIPGGIGSGTALIRPDLPELRTWPYFWQQSEYVLGGGTADFLLLAFAADALIK